MTAHEPPLVELLDDRDELRATQQKMIDAYRSGEPLAAGTIFVTSAGIPVPLGLRVATEPQQIATGFLHEMAATTGWVPTSTRSAVASCVSSSASGATRPTRSATAPPAACSASSRRCSPAATPGFADDSAAFEEPSTGCCDPCDPAAARNSCARAQVLAARA